MLVIYTDEPYLDHERVGNFLAGQQFKTQFFSDAILGLLRPVYPIPPDVPSAVV
jgi:hypothetical protein